MQNFNNYYILFREDTKKKESGDNVNDKETETALDLEDKWEAELRTFTPAARETEADLTNNRKSLERKLDTTLYLLVKQKIEGKDHWVLPQVYWKEGETMRQVRILFIKKQFKFTSRHLRPNL